jgi:hypothetical protein
VLLGRRVRFGNWVGLQSLFDGRVGTFLEHWEQLFNTGNARRNLWRWINLISLRFLFTGWTLLKGWALGIVWLEKGWDDMIGF